MKKKFIGTLGIILALLCYEDVFGLVTYNVNEMDTFKNRTKEQVGEKYGDAINNNGTYKDNDSNTYYKERYSLESPYSGGILTEDTHKTMVKMTDYYRWVMGINPFTSMSVHSDDLQVGALVRNYQFDHIISSSNKPADMSDELWNQGANASHNILARYSTPRGAIKSWINEGYDLKTQKFGAIGHRTALIAAVRSSVQFGFAGNIAIGKITGYSNDYVSPVVAFPAPGYVPTVDVVAPESAWHVEFDQNKITMPSIDNVTVTVTDLNTNELYDCTVANGKIGPLSGTNLIIFTQPSNSDLSKAYYEDLSRYKVEVTGLKDKSTGDDAKIVYTTEFFDVKDYTSTVAMKVTAPGGWTNLQIDSDVLTSHEEYLELVAAALPKTLDIQTETGRAATVSVAGNWIVDRNEQVFKNTLDKSSVPEYVIDRDNILNEVSISYETIDYTGNFGIDPTSVNLGKDVMIRIWRSASWLDQIEIFQVKNGNIIKRFDNESENFILKNQDMAGWDTVTFTANYDDAGSYFAIAHENNTKEKNAYLLTKSNGSMSELEVKDKAVSSFTVDLPKNVYKIGEELDTTGGKIHITYEDGTTNTKDLTSDMLGSFSSTTSGVKTLRVTYNGKSAEVKILVIYATSSEYTTYGRTLKDISLSSYSYGAYEFIDDLSTPVGPAGTNVFKGKFVPTSDEFEEMEVEINVHVSKANPEYSKSLSLKATYGNALKDIELPTSEIGVYEFVDDLNTSVGNSGYHYFDLRFVPFDSNYNTMTNVRASVYVYKATPTYTIPSGLVADKDTYLDDITLPEGWSWERPYTRLSESGVKTYKATFTPEDSNYKEVTGIDVPVRVRRTDGNYLEGDVTRDEVVDLLDVMYALRISLNLIGNISDEVIEIGDINSTGEIDLADVMYILRIALNLA